MTGCSQWGIASTGVVAPASIAIGGLMKKPINYACVCERVKVAMKVPSPTPDSTHSIPPK